MAAQYHQQHDYLNEVKWNEKAAQYGDLSAQLFVARAYEKRSKYTISAKWYEQAAAQGNRHAQATLGYFYHVGLG